jgi:tRNA-specific 2-thiouridylase
VIRKDVKSNTLIIGKKDELGSDYMMIDGMNWINGIPENLPENVTVKIRYKAPAIPADISLSENGSLCVKFEKPLRDITPGQQAVLYVNDLCLGGGLITRVKDA